MSKKNETVIAIFTSNTFLSPKVKPPKVTSREVKFLLLFLLLFGVFNFAFTASRGTVVERWVLDYATVKPSVAIINYFSPQIKVYADGHRIVSYQVRLSILNGCEGTENIFLLLAATLAFPATWRRKFVAASLGITLVFTLNQIRIFVLFHTLPNNLELFHFIHAYVGPTLIILLTSSFFLWWASDISQTRTNQIEPD